MSCARRHTGRSKARAKRFERATSTSVTGQRRRSRALAEKRQETRARGDPRVAVRPEATLRHAALSSQSAGPTRPARGSSIPTARAPRGSSLPTARAPTRRRDEWRGELHVVVRPELDDVVARARRTAGADAPARGSSIPTARARPRTTRNERPDLRERARRTRRVRRRRALAEKKRRLSTRKS